MRKRTGVVELRPRAYGHIKIRMNHMFVAAASFNPAIFRHMLVKLCVEANVLMKLINLSITADKIYIALKSYHLASSHKSHHEKAPPI